MPRRKRRADFGGDEDKWGEFKIADEEKRSKAKAARVMLTCKRGGHLSRTTSFAIKDDPIKNRNYETVFKGKYEQLVWQPEKDGSITVAIQCVGTTALKTVQDEFEGAISVRRCLWPGFVYNFRRPLDQYVDGPFVIRSSDEDLKEPLKTFVTRRDEIRKATQANKKRDAAWMISRVQKEQKQYNAQGPAAKSTAFLIADEDANRDYKTVCGGEYLTLVWRRHTDGRNIVLIRFAQPKSIDPIREAFPGCWMRTCGWRGVLQSFWPGHNGCDQGPYVLGKMTPTLAGFVKQRPN
jgi:hypothetical protein